MLREDNLGIGAKVGGKVNAETFGLSTLSGIFGRLNGKSDVEVEKQEKNLRDAELRTYQAQKFGYMNFVSGGLLVGDKIEEIPDKRLAATTVDGKAASADEGVGHSKKRKAAEDSVDVTQEKRSSKKKRKSGADEEIVAGSNAGVETALKPSKGGKKRDKSATTSTNTSENDETEATAAAKRERKDRRRAERSARDSSDPSVPNDKARLKLEKSARKEERRKRKEAKVLLKAEKLLAKSKRLRAETSDSDSDSSTEAAIVLATAKPVEEVLSSGVSTPTQVTTAALAFGGSRHAVRQRYIMQKRMASMDPKAMNEILMIKTAV